MDKQIADIELVNRAQPLCDGTHLKFCINIS